MGANQKSIPIINSSEEYLLSPEGAAATVIGWGDTDPTAGNNYPDQLLEVTVPIISQQTCYERYRDIGAEITSNMICAGYKVGGKDSCQGDSGGSLVVSDLDGGFVQTGVVSWGIGCAEPENYGVYTRLSRYSGWIESNSPSGACTPQDIAEQKC